MFVTRCLSAVVLVIIAVVALLFGGPVLLLTLFGISCVAFYELSKACGIHTEKKCNLIEGIGYVSIVGLYAMVYFAYQDIYAIFWIVLVFIAMMFVYVFAFPKYSAMQIMAAFFGVMYAPFMFSFIYHIRQTENGIFMVWMVFVCSWISDTFAYLVGMSIGKHKLAPVLSPKKSIEGSIGGVAGSALVGAIFGYIFANYTGQDMQMVYACAVIGAVGSIVSQIGDLAASAIKRNHEIKDYGHLIPGHGGIMDRFDSVIVSAPMIYFLVVFLMN